MIRVAAAGLVVLVGFAGGCDQGPVERSSGAEPDSVLIYREVLTQLRDQLEWETTLWVDHRLIRTAPSGRAHVPFEAIDYEGSSSDAIRAATDSVGGRSCFRTAVRECSAEIAKQEPYFVFGKIWRPMPSSLSIAIAVVEDYGDTLSDRQMRALFSLSGGQWVFDSLVTNSTS